MSLEELQEKMTELIFEEDTDKSFENFYRYLEDKGHETAFISKDGWRMTHLILMKLRFERLINAVPSMEELFKKDQEQFMKIFRAYHSASPQSSFFPQEEIEKFMEFYENWLLDT